MSNPRILIVDDDDVDRERLCRMLGRLDDSLELMEASSGRHALDLVDNNAFGYVFLDYHIGDMIGTDLVSTIKAHADALCPIIMITGMGDEQLAVEAMREGVHDYLPKDGLSISRLRASLENSRRSAKLEHELREAQARLERLSLYDDLTGLPNRNLFFDRLEQAIAYADRTTTPFALLMMDLNLFKEVNDTLGHQSGDMMLCQVGQRLNALARKSDTVARLGGDEFVALLRCTSAIEGAVTVAQKIIATMREPVPLGEALATVGISVGIALYPEHGADASRLMANADKAMYRAKRGTRGYEVYSAEHDPASSSTVLIASDVAKSIEHKQLVMHYQPKIDLGSGALCGVEALVRWQHPKLGMLGPDQFIAAAEKSAVIEPLTRATFDMALDQAAAWHATGRHLPVAVNLSARMLDDASLTQAVADALAKRDLPPEVLTIEITETAMMSNPTQARNLVRGLADIGVAISVDDFGTGYLSLRHLRDMPVAEIKIDRMFVAEMTSNGRDASIIRSIATLALGLSAELVAEGIEDLACSEQLRELGCRYGQGYAIAPPMPAEALDDWLRQRV